MITKLSKSFTVYAMDYPGHGWSDIPKTDYTADYFFNSVEKYLEKLDLKDVLIAGVSIGRSCALCAYGISASLHVTLTLLVYNSQNM